MVNQGVCVVGEHRHRDGHVCGNGRACRSKEGGKEKRERKKKKLEIRNVRM